MLDAEVVRRSVRIGKGYIFDRQNNIGYEVVRNVKNEVINFEAAFRLIEEKPGEYKCSILNNKDVAYGVLRKAIYIANMQGSSNNGK